MGRTPICVSALPRAVHTPRRSACQTPARPGHIPGTPPAHPRKKKCSGAHPCREIFNLTNFGSGIGSPDVFERSLVPRTNDPF